MSALPGDLRFSYRTCPSNGLTYLGFPIQRFEEWASKEGHPKSVIKDVTSLIRRSGIETSEEVRASEDPTDNQNFSLFVASIAEGLYDQGRIPDNHTAATLSRMLLKRFEEDVIDSVPPAVQYQSKEKHGDCDALWNALRGYSSQISTLQAEGDVGRLWRLSLEDRLSRVMTSEGIKSKYALAQAKYYVSRRIAELDAVAEALKDTDGSDRTSIEKAWPGYKPSGDTLHHLQDIKQAETLLNKAKSGGVDPTTALKRECRRIDSGLLDSITRAATDQLTGGLIHFKTRVVGARMQWSRQGNDSKPSIYSSPVATHR